MAEEYHPSYKYTNYKQKPVWFCCELKQEQKRALQVGERVSIWAAKRKSLAEIKKVQLHSSKVTFKPYFYIHDFSIIKILIFYAFLSNVEQMDH